jgi:UDP-glucose 4-epimerase
MWRHEYGLPFTILRYANVYGPRQDPHGEAGVVAIFSRRLQGGEPIRINAMRTRGDPGCIRDYVSVRDVVQANRFAADGRIAAAGIDILNVCTGRPATTADIARGLQAALGKQGELGFGPRRPGDLERSVLEQGPMVALLGEPEPLEEGLGRTARWFVDHPE